MSRSRVMRRLSSVCCSWYWRATAVRFGRALWVGGVWPRVDNRGTLELGDHCSFAGFTLRISLTVHKGGTLKIGDRAFINDGVNICATESVTIGRDTKIGDMTQVHDSDFHTVHPGVSMRRSPIVIGNNVWVGRNCVILAGVRIGDHSVIGAGSVVNGDIPECSVAAGVPARVVSTFECPEEWVRP